MYHLILWGGTGLASSKKLCGSSNELYMLLNGQKEIRERLSHTFETDVMLKDVNELGYRTESRT